MTYPLAFTGTGGIAASDTRFPHGQPMPQVLLTDIKQHLRKSQAKTDDDAELSMYLAAAQSRIASICLPLGPSSVIDEFDGNGVAGTLILSTFPVTAITSVTLYNQLGTPQLLAEAGGATGLSDGYRKNLSAGTLRRIGYRTWPRGWGNIVVEYTSGPDATPPEVIQAVKLTTQVWWESRRLSGNLRAPGGANGEPGDQPEPTFGLPDDAYDLLLNYLKPARVA